MKPLITLLFSCMISLSLMGQQDVKDQVKQLYDKKQQNSFTAFEKNMSRSPGYASRHLSRQFKAIQRTTLKADQASDQKMDSILWELYDTNTSTWSLSDRELFTYDGNGNQTGYVWFLFDTVDKKMYPEERQAVTFNAQDQPTEMVWLVWDEASGQWVNDEKYELTYDGEGNLIQETVYEWDTIGSQWLVIIRYDKTYDGSDNLIEDLWYFWNEDSSKLVLLYRDEYIYDGGRLTTWNEYYMEEGNLELTFYTTYTYENGNLTEEYTQGWDFSAGDWGDFEKTTYIYAGNRVVTEEQWRFDWSQYLMLRQSLFEFTYDADGNMETQTESEWDEEAGEAKSWNGVAAAWLITWRSVWTVNKNFTLTQLYVPFWFQSDEFDMSFVHMPVSELGYFNNNGTWDENYKQTAYYSEFGGGGPSGIKEKNEAPVSVFPNPASEFITFRWDEKYARLDLEIYDLTGKQLLTRSIQNNAVIMVDDLSRGIYIYKLTANKHLVNIGKISLR